MGRIILGYRPWSDAATLAGGSWSLPLNNVKDRSTSLIARSTNANTSSTQFTVTFSALTLTKMIYLRNVNVDVNATARMRGYSDTGMTSLVVDTGTFSIFPTVWSIDTPWEDDNFWGGTVTDWDDEERYPSIIKTFAAPVSCRAWRIEIMNTGNSAGYIQFDRLFISNYLTPSLNYAYSGNSFGFSDRTRVEESIGGQKFFDRRIAPRVFRFQFSELREDEVFASHYDFMRRVGADQEVLVIPNPDDEAKLLKRSFLGHLTRQDGITQVKSRLATAGYEVMELL